VKVMDHHPSLAELDKLKTRIQALGAKTIENGCTENEALSAATKVTHGILASFTARAAALTLLPRHDNIAA
jgi:hypothetical protein